jgi:imidazolonepropionase
MVLLIKNIACLVQSEDVARIRVTGKEMAQLPVVKNAFLKIENGIISDFGEMKNLDPDTLHHEIIDASGKFVFPSFCDSHTHLVYAGSREKEFVDKIHGLSYGEIAKRGGGILNSADRLHNTSENELFNQAMVRINEITGLGTGAVEIKSGYGLNVEDELKMLRVIRMIRDFSPLEVKATFLGAHALPMIYKNERDKYVDLVINEMIPAVAAEDLADYIDVF